MELDTASGWARLMADHAQASQRHADAVRAATQAMAHLNEIERRRPHADASVAVRAAYVRARTAAEDTDLAWELDADLAYEQLMRLEQLALSRPAKGDDAFCFKIALWERGRTDSCARSRSVFASECERFLGATDKA